MGEVSSIEWTEATWNPWHGCTKVSPGCAHCYMYRQKRWRGQDAEVVLRSKTKFYEPLRWSEPKLVFTCSWSDWFHEAADEWRDEAWSVIARCPQHVFQILTKRPERFLDCLPTYWPLPNLWLGVSVENQRWADVRIPLLKKTPGVIRFLSCEPLLAPLDLRAHLADGVVDWCIAGGESGGPEHRRLVEMSDGSWVPKGACLDWVRAIRDQCVRAGVAFFFKQWGGPRPTSGGRILDGRTWDEMPGRSVREAIRSSLTR